MQRYRNYAINVVSQSIFPQFATPPVTQKSPDLGLIFVFQVVDEVFYNPFFTVKKESSSLFNGNSAVKNTINGIFLVECVLGKGQLISTNCA
jgi:hypothetical protein